MSKESKKYYNSEGEMKKKQWKKNIIIIVTVVIFISAFVAVVQIVRWHQKFKSVNEETEKAFADYKTGEVLTIQDAYQAAGLDTVTYIAFQCHDNINLQEKFRHIYFVCDRAVIQRIVDEVSRIKFEVSNTLSASITDGAKWELWLGISDKENILISTSNTLWKGIGSCKFALTEPGSYSTITDDFMWDYFLNGLFIDDKISDILKDIVLHEIGDISLEQAEAYINKESGPQLWEFQQYYYGESGYNQTGNPRFQYELSDYDGYIMVEWSTLQGHYQEITSISLYDNNDVFQRILYENQIDEE